MEKSPSWEANRSSVGQEIPHIFWNPKGTLQHIQAPITCPYPEPEQSSPYLHPTSWKSILILPSHLHIGFPSSLFPSGFSPKPCMHPPSPTPTPPTSVFLIWSLEQYLVRSTDHKAPHYDVFSSPLLCYPS